MPFKGLVFSAVVLMLVMCASVAQATPILVSWTGSNVFSPDEELAVTPFVADAFLGASGNSFYGRMPGVSQKAILQGRIDGVWTTLASSVFTNVVDPLPLASQWAPATFTAGTIDGIRIQALDVFARTGFAFDSGACDFFSGCFRNMSNLSLSFNDPTAVPELASMALLTAGLIGLALRRRRRAAKSWR